MVKKFKKDRLWYRIGDSDEYHHVGDDLDALVGVFQECRIGENLVQCCSGINTDDYRGWNYISLYWGDEYANHVGNISKQEFAYIKKQLEGA